MDLLLWEKLRDVLADVVDLVGGWLVNIVIYSECLHQLLPGHHHNLEGGLLWESALKLLVLLDKCISSFLPDADNQVVNDAAVVVGNYCFSISDYARFCQQGFAWNEWFTQMLLLTQTRSNCEQSL